MGGRGSAGSGGSSRSGNVKLPELKGSAKQVAWAKDIREEFLSSAASIVKQAGSELGLTNMHGFPISVAGAKAMQKEVIKGFSTATEAKYIIDLKQNARHTYDFLKNWAEQETRKRKK